MMRGKKPQWVTELASDRIRTLLELAGANKKSKPERSRRYVELARKIAERYNVRMTLPQKKSFCRKCSSYFTAENSKTRVAPKSRAVVRVCLLCGFRKTYGGLR
jgi:ribonuclease P protein subunit RPR2